MGASFSLQTQINNINNSIKNQLEQKAEASASANCEVSIGNISFEETKGCAIKVTNLCSSQADAQLQAINETITKFYDDLTNEQKNMVPMIFTSTFGVSTTVNNFKTDYVNTINQKCSSFASSNPTLKINDISIKKCESIDNNPLYFEFVNSGTALGQCGVESLNKLLATSTAIIKNKQETGIDFNALIWPIVLCIIVISIVTFLIKFFFKKNDNNEENTIFKKKF